VLLQWQAMSAPPLRISKLKAVFYLPAVAFGRCLLCKKASMQSSFFCRLSSANFHTVKHYGFTLYTETLSFFCLFQSLSLFFLRELSMTKHVTPPPPIIQKSIPKQGLRTQENGVLKIGIPF
jgi:hypothetical protein